MRINFTKLTICSIIFLTMFFSLETFAQKALPSGTQIVSAIGGDTTSTGARINTSYTLARGGVYFALGSLKSNFNLTISATGDASLADPKIIVLTDASGNYSTPFVPYKNLTLTGISLTGVNSAGTQISYIIEAGTTGPRIKLTDCEMDSVTTAAVRINYNGCSIFVEDCYIHNIAGGNHTGRFIDARRTVLDTVSIVNSTFYNVMHNVVGRFEGGQKLFKFDHNTVYNLMRCPIRIDECPNIVVTNNLFLQTGFVGYIKYWETAYRAATSEAMESRDEFARIEIWDLTKSTTFAGQTQKSNFKYNNLWLDPTIKSTFPDTIYQYKNLDFDFEKKIVGADTLTWLSENCSFTKSPTCNYSRMAITSWADGSTQTDPGFNDSGKPFNFAYSTTSKSYTAGAGGFPLGDLNWFPARKAAWKTWLTDVKENTATTIPTSFNLEQNYPNPFNPTTSIKFEVPKQGVYAVRVFNLLGQEVCTLVNEKMDAGAHQVAFNAAKLSSGVYFYSLTGSDVNITKKMILMK